MKSYGKKTFRRWGLVLTIGYGLHRFGLMGEWDSAWKSVRVFIGPLWACGRLEE
jgi:hypothetical protein